MSFLNIKDKRLRDQTIDDYLALKKRLKSRYLDENVEDQTYQRDLQEQYEPVVAAQERMTQDITDQLIPMKDQIQELAALTLPKTEEIQTEEPGEMQEEEQVMKREPFDLNEFGPQLQAFFLAYMDEESRKRNIDTNFGIRFENGMWKIGNKRVTINSFALNKTTNGGIKFLPRPKLAAVPGDGLYLRHGSDIYHGEGLILGESSPFRNIRVLGWLL